MKIETLPARGAAVLRLAGRIQADDVGELRVHIRKHGARVVLDLDEVTLVDPEAVDFLAACQGEGVELLHCSPYIREWMGTRPRPRRFSFTPHGPKEGAMPAITTRDGAQIFYKDWGSGQPVVFSHGWPLNADAWDDQLFFFAAHGYRAIAHDRRGHGRSSQTWAGNDMDTYADDLAAVTEALDLRDAVHVGHSTGGGEVVRYIARHGTGRVAGAVLVAAIPPLMLRTPDHPEGVPMEAFDQIRAGVTGDRPQYWKELSAPFYGANREGSQVSQGVRDAFWLLGMQCGLAAAFDCIKAFSESDFRQDLGKVDVPTLVIHGDDDQIVPITVGGLRSSRMIPGATLKVYPGAPHGLMSTHRDQFNADLLEFARQVAAQPVGATAAPAELVAGIGRVVSD